MVELRKVKSDVNLEAANTVKLSACELLDPALLTHDRSSSITLSQLPRRAPDK